MFLSFIDDDAGKVDAVEESKGRILQSEGRITQGNVIGNCKALTVVFQG